MGMQQNEGQAAERNLQAAPALATVLGDIDEICQAGLNSEAPAHWEAALGDILAHVRALSPLSEAR